MKQYIVDRRVDAGRLAEEIKRQFEKDINRWADEVDLSRLGGQFAEGDSLHNALLHYATWLVDSLEIYDEPDLPPVTITPDTKRWMVSLIVSRWKSRIYAS